ncbi:MAG: HAD family hydrolase [Planctomycetes bacterium]|nr:HAD family hydrolase [Planctomycetota bacterium]
MSPLPVHAVLFDLDGTITRPVLDFSAIRSAIGIADGTPVLEYLDRLDGEARARGHAVLESFETQAAENAEFNHGVAELFQFLDRARVRTAVVTRNSRSSARLTLRKLGLEVMALVCREDAPAKPSPEPALLAARLVQADPPHCLFVGDYEFDVRTGLAAGMRTVLIPSRPPGPAMPRPDYQVASARDLIPILQALNGNGGDRRVRM